jgi:hypothetical protein
MPSFAIPLCEELNLGWSIIKNCTEGSSGKTHAAQNKFRERLVVLFPQDMDSLPNLVEDEPPPFYIDRKEEDERIAKSKRNIFDSLSKGGLQGLS